MNPVLSASKLRSDGFRGGRVELCEVRAGGEANSGSSRRSADEVREATSLKRKRGVSFNSCVR